LFQIAIKTTLDSLHEKFPDLLPQQCKYLKFNGQFLFTGFSLNFLR